MEKEPMSFRDCLELIKLDYATQFGGGLRGILPRYILDVGIFASVNYRIAHYLYVKGWGRVAQLLMKITTRISSVTIYPEAEIGPGFALNHGDGAKIGWTAVIGKHCIMHHDVLLGRNFGKERTDENGVMYDQPRIGDYTHLCPGCYILGPVHIGDHVIIGPRAIVAEDIPSYSLVVGQHEVVVKPIDPSNPVHLERFATVLPQAWDQEWQQKFDWTGDDAGEGGSATSA